MRGEVADSPGGRVKEKCLFLVVPFELFPRSDPGTGPATFLQLGFVGGVQVESEGSVLMGLRLAFLEWRLAGLDNGLVGDGKGGEVGLGQAVGVIAVPNEEVGDKALLREGALASNVVHRCLLFKHSNRKYSNCIFAILFSSLPSIFPPPSFFLQP